MFECRECNVDSQEILVETGTKWFGLLAYRKVVYLRDLEEPCGGCGTPQGYKVILDEDSHVRPVGWLLGA